MEKVREAAGCLRFIPTSECALRDDGVKGRRQGLYGLREIVVAMGLESPWQITPAHIHERLGRARAAPVDEIYRFLPEGALLDDPGATQYAGAWDAAQATSFARTKVEAR